MRTKSKTDEVRWKVIRAMLEEFPELKERTREYLGQSLRKCAG
jgi:hypothetical protein